MHLMLQMGIYQDIYLMYMTFYFAFFLAHIRGSWPTDQPVSTGFRWPESEKHGRTQDTVTPLLFRSEFVVCSGRMRNILISLISHSIA